VQYSKEGSFDEGNERVQVNVNTQTPLLKLFGPFQDKLKLKDVKEELAIASQSAAGKV
jgi:hypothetical protein